MWRIRVRFVAWGSGWASGSGAMAAGATAYEAVKIASRFDAYTRGPFKEYEI